MTAINNSSAVTTAVHRLKPGCLNRPEAAAEASSVDFDPESTCNSRPA